MYMIEYIYEIDGFRITKKKELIRCKNCKYQRYDEVKQFHYCSFAKNAPFGEDNGHCNFGDKKKS